MIVINGNFGVNGEISVCVLQVTPVYTIKASWGEGEHEELVSANN